MRSPALLFALTLILGTVPLVTGPAAAEPRDDAVKLANQGFDLMEKGKFGEASDLFRRAAELYYSPVIALYWAKAEARQGKLLQAREITKTIIDKPLPSDAKPSWTGAIDDARTFLTSLEPRIPRIRVRVNGPGAENARIEIDGKEAAADKEIEVNPGSHEVSATPKDGAARSEDVDVGEGDARTVELTFASEATVDPASPSLLAPIIAYSIGGAGLIVGVITGGIFIGKAGELKDACPHETCPPDQEELLDETTVLGNVATVAWVIAGLGAAVGTVLLFVPIGGDEPVATIGIAPTGASLHGRF